MAVGIGLQFLHGFADLERCCVGRHGLAETYGDRIGNRARHFPKEAAALETENAAPYSIEIYGNDWDFYALHDAFETTAEGKKLTGAGDLSFGEDADDLVLTEGFAGCVQGSDHVAGAQFA
jgi:hypothetical protein